jgi:hypothetical protein
MYKVVEIQPYSHTGIDGKTSVVKPHENIGVGYFKNEGDITYSLVCTICHNLGSAEEQKKHAALISTLLNENRKYVLE